MANKEHKIAVLLSGGVDSSVALRVLQEEGFQDIRAFYLKIWLEDELQFLGDCPWEEDLSFARQVCEKAGIPLTVVPLQREYYDRVVTYAVNELKSGKTPSPDIFCNSRIKFGLFPEKIGTEYTKIASGHYAIIRKVGRKHLLLRSPDPVKDQTYFLSHQKQEQIARSLFPIGHLQKKEVRELARSMDLPNKNRKDSQGICFLGKIRYPEFVKHYLGEKTGEIREIDTDRVLGEHQGFWFYTIGQRQGLGLGSGPWYVCNKDVGNNIIYVTHQEHVDDHTRDAFCISNLSWIAYPPEDGRFGIKIRHGPGIENCTISRTGADELSVKLDNPEQGIAPGQIAVLYNDDICLGGGVIS